MDPVDFAEAVVASINAKFTPEEGMVVAAELALDPQTVLDHDELKCFVIPDIVVYNLGERSGRRKTITTSSTKFVSIILATTFSQLNKGVDLTKWTEARKVLKTRYELDAFLLGLFYSKNRVTEIECNLPDEVELDHRNFVTVTTIGFGSQECVSEPE